jgi:hypothetical protein
MVTELFPLVLEFRDLSDEEGDEVETSSPDTDLDDDTDEDDDALGDANDDDSTSDNGDPIE